MIDELTKQELDDVLIKIKKEFKVYKNYEYKNRYYDINIQRIVVLKLADLFNFNVYENENLPTFIDGIIRVNNKDKSIVIRSNLKPKDKRYLILYLLSYYMIHLNSKNINYHTGYGSIEKMQRNELAEYMARNLLVPKDELLKLENHFHNPEFCAKVFRTDEDLINLRINEIITKKKTLLDMFKLKKK